MPKIVCDGALLQCSFGAAPAPLVVLPASRVLVGGLAIASMMDSLPLVDIAPFGLCSSPSDPMVMAQTNAGTLTPAPCVPVTVAPWAPGNDLLKINDLPVLDEHAELMCVWAGVIQIAFPAQSSLVTLP